MYSDDLRDKVREIFRKNKNYRSVALSWTWGILLFIIWSTKITHDSRTKLDLEKSLHKSKQLWSNSKSTVYSLKTKVFLYCSSKNQENCQVEDSLRTVLKAISKLGITYKKIPNKSLSRIITRKNWLSLSESWSATMCLARTLSSRMKSGSDLIDQTTGSRGMTHSILSNE